MKTDGRFARPGCGHNIRMILAHLRALVAMLFAALMEATAHIIADARPNCTKAGAAA